MNLRMFQHSPGRVVTRDGVMYQFDASRGKFLSVTPFQYTFSKEATSNDNDFWHPGQVLVSDFGTGPAFVRPVTILGFNLTIEQVATAAVGFEIYTKVLPGAATGVLVFTLGTDAGTKVPVDADPQNELVTDLDIDVATNQLVTVRQDSAVSGQAVDPVLVLDLAWHLV